MAQIGLLQPVVVRPVQSEALERRRASAETGQGAATPAFELVAGERRVRCARQLNWVTIPAVIRPTDDADLLRDALLENVHRANLNPLEEAAAYQQLLSDFACTQEQLAERVGRSRPQIANTLRLLRLPPAVQRRVAAGVLSQGHARALLALPDERAMEELAARIVAEGLSVRMAEEIVAVGQRSTPPRARAPRTTTDAADLRDLAEDLGDRWDTRVQVTMGRTKGKVTIEFAGREDLERILELLTTDGTPT
jgi:ParB family chromosome partitioning protein